MSVAIAAQSAMSQHWGGHGHWGGAGYAPTGGYHGPLAAPVVTAHGFLADTPEVGSYRFFRRRSKLEVFTDLTRKWEIFPKSVFRRLRVSGLFYAHVTSNSSDQLELIIKLNCMAQIFDKMADRILSSSSILMGIELLKQP